MASITERRQPEFGQGAELGRSGGTGFDFTQVKTTVADKLHGAAQMLQEKMGRTDSNSELGRFGQRASDWIERSADYVNELEPQQLRTDLETQVRRNPGRSLLIAGAVGLVLGRLLRRR
jgi:ElaB/YqjD/DUF883 family membrane-anchored ribosome-binding protein